MRAFGVDEKYITGDGDSRIKFLYWAKTIERLIGSQLFKVLPTFRPDKLFNMDQPGFAETVSLVEGQFKIKTDSFDQLKIALSASLDYFCALGCRLSDHAFSSFAVTDSESVTAVLTQYGGFGLCDRRRDSCRRRVFGVLRRLRVVK